MLARWPVGQDVKGSGSADFGPYFCLFLPLSVPL
jgi:hypothetical protein